MADLDVPHGKGSRGDVGAVLERVVQPQGCWLRSWVLPVHPPGRHLAPAPQQHIRGASISSKSLTLHTSTGLPLPITSP